MHIYFIYTYMFIHMHSSRGPRPLEGVEGACVSGRCPAHIHIYIYIYIHTHISGRCPAHIYIYIYIYVYIYIHTYTQHINIYTYIHIHTHMTETIVSACTLCL